MLSNFCDKKRRNIEIKSLLLAILSALFSALGLWVFVAPGKFAPSGVDGIAAMLQELSKRMVDGQGIPAGYFSTLLNVPLLLIAWFVLKRRYVVYTIIYMGLVSGFTALFAMVKFPVYIVENETNRFLAAIIGGAAQGLTGIMLKVGGSAGGVDVIACMIQKKRQSQNVEKIIALLSYIIAIFSFFVWHDFDSVIFSFIAIFVCEKVTADILKDARSAVKFEIIADKKNAEQIRNMIIYEAKRGATILKAQGAFFEDEKEVIICLVHYRQFHEFLMKISNYPYAFLSYSNVLGLRGNFDWIVGYEKDVDIDMREKKVKASFTTSEYKSSEKESGCLVKHSCE